MAKRLPFLYVGKNAVANTHKTYTAQDLANYVYPSQFVIVPGNYWDYFTATGGLTSEADTLAEQVATLAKLICNNTSTNFYIGTPLITDKVNNNHTSSESSYRSAYSNLQSSHKTFIDKVKSKIGASLFNSRCEGVYMNAEDMGNFYLNPSNMSNHPHYALFKYVSDYVHNTLGKELIWSPFYTIDTAVENIAKMSTTTVFDYIFIQPAWYFQDGDANGSYGNNCKRVFESVRDQKVYHKNGSLIVSGATRTILGVQMEVDTMYYKDTKYKNKYQDYYNQFYPYRWNYNFGFYHGHKLDAISHMGSESYQTKLVKEVVAPFIS